MTAQSNSTRPRLTAKAKPPTTLRGWFSQSADTEPDYADADAKEAMAFIRKQNARFARSLADKEKSPDGRLSPFQLMEIYRMAQTGLDMTRVGYCLGYTPTQLRYAMDKDPRAKWMYLEGRAKAAQFATGLLWKKIRQGDNTCLIFYLKTQLKWSEKVTVALEHDLQDLIGATDGTIMKDRLKGMTTTELMEFAALLGKVEMRRNAIPSGAPVQEVEDADFIERPRI